MQHSPPPSQTEAAADEKHWKCDRCSSTFKRQDHLKRHSATHKTQRSHACHFCGALFSRGDVLRRHWKSCKTRLENGIEMPESHRGGKHKRACDSCASIRKACNGENPCSECNHRGRPCTYQRLYEDIDWPTSSVRDDAEKNDPKVDASESEMDIDDTAGQAGPSGPVWELGLQSFYPSRETGRIVYARNNFGT